MLAKDDTQQQDADESLSEPVAKAYHAIRMVVDNIDDLLRKLPSGTVSQRSAIAFITEMKSTAIKLQSDLAKIVD